MSDAARELVGQSLMLSFDGQELTPALAALLARARPCGVVLFARNIAGPAQLRRLCDDLQAHAVTLGLPPLLIAIDQEGGVVSRLPEPFVVPPSPQSQSVAGPGAARAAASITGRQLRAHGVNVNFAPALDVSLNPDNPVIGIRGFGPDPVTVARLGAEALAGYAAAGVIAVVKHFPGHGDTAVDSHLGLPVVPHGRERLDRVELAPFRAALAAGAPAVMAAHIVFSAIDDRPATLSPPILRGLLRGELAFDDLVFTDALDMAAIAARHGAAEACVLAREAGADLLLPLGDPAGQAAAADALAAALAAGRLAASDFAATARRLARLRAAYDLGRPLPPAAPSDPALGAEALALARRGTTRHNPRGLLPLRRDVRLAVVDCLLPRFNNAEEALSRADLLRGLLAEAFPAATYTSLAPDAPPEAWARAAEPPDADALLLVTRNAWFIPAQARLGATLAAGPAPLIHLAARSPYDVERLPGAAASLRTYGDPPVSLVAAVEALGRP